MEAFSFGHRLTNLYSDTKKACDVVSAREKVLNVPELVALHLEFRIQNERLQAWGLEWKDDNSAAGECSIDESIERAGFTEVVTDVLTGIQRILEEAERIRTSGSLGGSFSDVKTRAWVQADMRWSLADRSRYEQLAKDLTEAIDLLFQLSKERRAMRERSDQAAGKRSETPASFTSEKTFFTTSGYNASEETLVSSTLWTNPSRSSTSKTNSSIELPPRLSPDMLELPEEEPPPYDSVGATVSSRMIASLRQPAPLSSSETGMVLLPVLVEWAPFDPAYRVTGVSVPQQRLQGLINFYGRCSALGDYSTCATLPCLGYFEDPKEPRFGLVYELPKSTASDNSPDRAQNARIRPVSLLKVLQSTSKSLNTTNRALPPGPALEDRFRLAYNIVLAFSKIHVEEGLVHKDVNSGNVIFFQKPHQQTTDSDGTKTEYDLRRPYISSFDLFSEFSLEKLPTSPGRNLYRHPEDPRASEKSCKVCAAAECRCCKARFDIYGLALILLEIGLWIPISDLFKPKYNLTNFKDRVEKIWVKKLASRCGTVYMNVAKDCLEQAARDITEDELRFLYDRWLSKLRRCCSLDEEEEITPATSFQSTGTTLSSARPSLPPFSQQSIAAAISGSFSKFNPKRTSLPYSISEAAEDDSLFKQQSAITSFRGDGDNISVTSTYHKAAQVIQRAWRSRSGTSAFQEYRRKVTLIQRCWRKRQSRSSSPDIEPEGARSQIFATLTESPKRIQESRFENSEIRISHRTLPAKPKLRLHTVKMHHELLEHWHQNMLPRLERIIEKTLKDSPETVSIDLVGVGDTALSAKPTIFVTCTSIAKVRCAINKKFIYDHNVFDLKVRRGKLRRSKVTGRKKAAPPHRSMMNEYSQSDDAPLNPFHQQRPLCGASIGAFVDKHLPPVSFGGVINVDGEAYGLTVHHLLDAPSDDEDENSEYDDASTGATRSAARNRNEIPWLTGIASNPTLQTVPTDSMFALEISDESEPELMSAEADISEDDCASDDDSDSQRTESSGTQGDLTGIAPGEGLSIYVTQPALDDVDDDFFPCVEDRDEDHMDSHKLGYVHASSGIRRWTRNGIVHEIDWALLKIDEERLQPFNLVQGGKKYYPAAGNNFHPKLLEPICRGQYKAEDDEYPNEVAKSNDLGNLHVHCFGRTSGLQGGIVGPAMSSVRIYRRRSFSRSWHVIGDFGGKCFPHISSESRLTTLVGGDSGAWVIDNEQGRVCGHVLAWCERNAIAYICPMEVLFEDIKNTLGAKQICLPGGDEVGRQRGVVEDFFREANGRLHFLEEKATTGAANDLPDIASLDFAEKRDNVLSSSQRISMEYPRHYLDGAGQIA